MATSPLLGWPKLRESLEILGIDPIVEVSMYLVLMTWDRKGTYIEVLLCARHNDACVLKPSTTQREICKYWVYISKTEAWRG